MSIFGNFQRRVVYKLILSIVVFSGFITIIITAMQLYFEYQRDVMIIDVQFEQIEKSFLKTISQALWHYDEELLTAQLEGIYQLRDIEFVEVVDIQNYTISLGDAEFKNEVTKTYDLIYKYKWKVRNIGKLTASASYRGIYDRLYDRVIVILFSSAAKTFLTSLFMLVLFQFLVTRHLETIAAFFRTYSLDAEASTLELDKAKPPRGIGDELSQIEIEINNLIGNIRNSYDLVQSTVHKRTSELQTANEILKQSEERFKAMFHNAPIGICLVNPEKKPVMTNPVIRNLLGYNDRELGRMCFEDFSHPDDAEAESELFDNLFTSRINHFSMEKRTIRKDGQIIWVSLHVAAIRSDDGNTSPAVAMIQDITERKLAEAEKAETEARKRQIRKAESLGRMAGAIAHHFNNQLSVIMGNLEMIMHVIPDHASTMKNLNNAMSAVRRSSEVSGLMLTYLGQNPSRTEPMDLSVFVSNTLPILKQSIPGNIRLITRFTSVGPIIRANENQLRLIITNILINAWESIAQNRGIIRFQIRQVFELDTLRHHLTPPDWTPKKDTYACLIVSDTGCGIVPEELDKIFDPFYTTKFTGRGLGLSVVLGIVKSWGGAVAVESVPDRGSTMRVFLPVVSEALPQRRTTDHPIRKSESGGMLLLVEDQENVREMLQDMIMLMGFTSISACSGYQAVELFKTYAGSIQCVITDLTMPGMNGLQTLAAIRKIDPSMPAVLLSGYDEAHAMDADYPEQPQAFLHKPFSHEELKKILMQVLGIKESSIIPGLDSLR